MCMTRIWVCFIPVKFLYKTKAWTIEVRYFWPYPSPIWHFFNIDSLKPVTSFIFRWEQIVIAGKLSFPTWSPGRSFDNVPLGKLSYLIIHKMVWNKVKRKQPRKTKMCKDCLMVFSSSIFDHVTGRNERTRHCTLSSLCNVLLYMKYSMFPSSHWINGKCKIICHEVRLTPSNNVH